MKTDQKATNTALFNGKYTYFVVRKTIEKIVTTSNYTDRKSNLTVNIDGLPLFKSSSLQLWPILIRFSSFKPVPFVFYCGYKKPDMGEYLVEFVDEMEKLISELLVVNGSRYELSIYTFNCEAPARALLKGIVQGAGCYACERCTKKGTSIAGRIVHHRTEKSILRSNNTFMSKDYIEKDKIGKSHQVAPSPIRRLNINMINAFILDYMHMVCLGVVKGMLHYFKGHFKNVLNVRLSQSSLNEITSRLLSIKGKLPSEFARQPRLLNELDRWKTTELRSFLLYTGPIALKGLLSSSYYNHFLSLSFSIRILCDDNEIKRNVLLGSLKKLHSYFVCNSKGFYGDTFCFFQCPWINWHCR